MMNIYDAQKAFELFCELLAIEDQDINEITIYLNIRDVPRVEVRHIGLRKGTTEVYDEIRKYKLMPYESQNGGS